MPCCSNTSVLSENHVCYIILKVPLNCDEKEIINWIKDVFTNYFVKYKCMPPISYIQHEIYLSFPDTEYEEFAFTMNLSDEQAFLWACSESMDSHTTVKNEIECPKHVYNAKVCGLPELWKCPICLESNKQNLICTNVCHCAFHKDCFFESYQYMELCPVCMKDIDLYHVDFEIIV